ncbi:MAG: hypothetical protein ACTMIR_09900 [Cellulomonadaceae bacterium]
MNVPTAPLPEPVALRLRPPRWRDPRLVVGVLLVAGSVALGTWAVTAGARTVGVYAASGAITPGQRIDVEALEVVQARAERLPQTYLLASEPLPDDAFALRVVGPGELVPLSAVGTLDQLDLRSVAVPVGADLSAQVGPGTLVDLWHVPEAEDEGAPRRFATSVVVHEVSTGSGAMIGVGGAALHVLVAQDSLADVLGALGAPGAVRIVVVPGSGP